MQLAVEPQLDAVVAAENDRQLPGGWRGDRAEQVGGRKGLGAEREWPTVADSLDLNPLQRVDHACLLGSREIPWNRQRDFSGCRPLGTTTNNRLEPDAFHRVVTVPHHGGEDPSLSVGNPPDHRFVCRGPPLILGRIGGGQNMHVHSRAPQSVVQFVPEVHPLGGNSSHDRVLAIAGDNAEGVLGAASGTRPLSLRDSNDLAVVADRDPAAGLDSTPANPDHLVELAPLWERIVGRVHDHHRATVGDVLDQPCLNGCRPGLAVVVGEHDVKLVECGTEPAPRRIGPPRGRRGDHFDAEPARPGQEGPQYLRRGSPVVVVLPIDDQQPELLGLL